MAMKQVLAEILRMGLWEDIDLEQAIGRCITLFIVLWVAFAVAGKR